MPGVEGSHHQFLAVLVALQNKMEVNITVTPGENFSLETHFSDPNGYASLDNLMIFYSVFFGTLSIITLIVIIFQLKYVWEMYFDMGYIALWCLIIEFIFALGNVILCLTLIRKTCLQRGSVVVLSRCVQ